MRDPKSTSRRGFFGTVTKASFAGAAAVAGLWPTKAHALRRVKCCTLEFDANCPNLSCFTAGHNWWSWACCHNGLVYDCYECYDWRCSLANYPGSCHCREANGARVAAPC